MADDTELKDYFTQPPPPKHEKQRHRSPLGHSMGDLNGTYEPVEPTDWGLVIVMKGEHMGKIGYYEDEGERSSCGIVYFGHPLIDPYVEIPLKYLYKPASGTVFISLDQKRVDKKWAKLTRTAGK